MIRKGPDEGEFLRKRYSERNDVEGAGRARPWSNELLGSEPSEESREMDTMNGLLHWRVPAITDSKNMGGLDCIFMDLGGTQQWHPFGVQPDDTLYHSGTTKTVPVVEKSNPNIGDGKSCSPPVKIRPHYMRYNSLSREVGVIWGDSSNQLHFDGDGRGYLEGVIGRARSKDLEEARNTWKPLSIDRGGIHSCVGGSVGWIHWQKRRRVREER